MPKQDKTRVAVIYGGTNTEHEVSIITALQVMHALSEAGYPVLPLYVSKQGKIFLGDDRYLKPETYQNLKTASNAGKPAIISNHQDKGVVLTKRTLGGFQVHQSFEVAFPVFHGLNGEDGSIQGMLQFLDIPYAGCQITASAIGNNKHISKNFAQEVGLVTVPDVLVGEQEWKDNREEILRKVTKELGKVVYVKPNHLGSSIGITRATNKKDLENGLEVAFAYDTEVLVEKALANMREVNISILGNNPYELSITEQPLSSAEILSFEDKYLSEEGNKGAKSQGMASAKRIMPAPISKELRVIIEGKTKDFFGIIGGTGIARIDYMISRETIYFNEINTIPGSLAFYLWEKSGVKFPELVSKLVEMAQAHYSVKKQKVNTFESNILSFYKKRGVKS